MEIRAWIWGLWGERNCHSWIRTQTKNRKHKTPERKTHDNCVKYRFVLPFTEGFRVLLGFAYRAQESQGKNLIGNSSFAKENGLAMWKQKEKTDQKLHCRADEWKQSQCAHLLPGFSMLWLQSTTSFRKSVLWVVRKQIGLLQKNKQRLRV
jgi:hypothetical protein